MKTECPDTGDCIDAPEEIKEICPYDALCGKCEYYVIIGEQDGLLEGTCLKKPSLGPIDCKREPCDRYALRGTVKKIQQTVEVLDMERDELKEVLKEVLDETLGISELTMAKKWEGGEIIIRPGNKDLQEKSIPIDSFFHKIVMVRDRLRVLEQKINAHSGLTDEDKVEIHQYITRMYGSLTTFNIFFADKEDQFIGEKSK